MVNINIPKKILHIIVVRIAFRLLVSNTSSCCSFLPKDVEIVRLPPLNHFNIFCGNPPTLDCFIQHFVICRSDILLFLHCVGLPQVNWSLFFANQTATCLSHTPSRSQHFLRAPDRSGLFHFAFWICYENLLSGWLLGFCV